MTYSKNNRPSRKKERLLYLESHPIHWFADKTCPQGQVWATYFRHIGQPNAEELRFTSCTFERGYYWVKTNADAKRLEGHFIGIVYEIR